MIDSVRFISFSAELRLFFVHLRHAAKQLVGKKLHYFEKEPSF
jgi:hypothetical protein